jgi:hypothetical protein
MTQNYETDGALAVANDMQEDEGMAVTLRNHPEAMVGRAELAERSVAALEVEELSLVERAVIGYNKHRKGVKRVLGSLSIGSGFIVGGAIAAHHRR